MPSYKTNTRRTCEFVLKGNGKEIEEGGADMTIIREGYTEEKLSEVFEHVASGSCTTCCDTCSND